MVSSGLERAPAPSGQRLAVAVTSLTRRRRSVPPAADQGDAASDAVPPPFKRAALADRYGRRWRRGLSISNKLQAPAAAAGGRSSAGKGGALARPHAPF